MQSGRDTIDLVQLHGEASTLSSTFRNLGGVAGKIDQVSEYVGG